MQDKALMLKAYRLMCTEREMARLYDENRSITKYVHSTSRGHEAIQLAAGFQLKPWDYASLYYRDDSILLGMGMEPYEIMLQLLAKRDDPFSGGRSYYAHPSLRKECFPVIPHQSSATGMQAIPTTGVAHGIHYLENRNLLDTKEKPVVLCSMGDGSITEGEVSEAFQQAVLNQLPVFYLIQDNSWGISVSSGEMSAMDAFQFAAGFKGMKRKRVNGSDFLESYRAIEECMEYVRNERKPILLHAKCPLLGHHTSGVRKEFYRDEKDLSKHAKDDPVPLLEKKLQQKGVKKKELQEINEEAINRANEAFQRAVDAPGPDPATLKHHEFSETPVKEEKGERTPKGNRDVIMVDAALYAIQEIMQEDEKTLLYGQDVGRRLGGVFREAATLAEKFGDDRVFNTPIHEAYIIGSTAGMSAAGIKAFVEVQFCDYIWPGINQLVTELSKSCYLSMGKFPVSSVIRVPIGAYGGGGPYHSGSHEASLTPVKGIKIGFPSTAADMKGLMKSAYLDPNPVVMLEHKGLYWSKVPGTENAKTREPSRDYVIPFGKGRVALQPDAGKVKEGDSMCVITYGMGVHWALNAAKNFQGRLEIIDLRSLCPLDEELVFDTVKKHGKCLVLTEEPVTNSFAQSLAGRINENCFEFLDAPVFSMGAEDLPGVPLNMTLESYMLPSAEKVAKRLDAIFKY